MAGTSAALGLVGTTYAGQSVEAAPTTLCPQNTDFWAFHAWPEGMIDKSTEDSVTLARVTKTCDEWRTFLLTTPSDRSHLLAQQVLAIQNNLYYRLNTDFQCSDHIPSSFRGTNFEGKTISDIKNMAIAWLYHSNWSLSFDGKAQLDWEVRINNEKYDGAIVDAEPIYEVLRAFNNNEFQELDCGCDSPTTISIASVETTPPEQERSVPLSETPVEREPASNDRIPDVL